MSKLQKRAQISQLNRTLPISQSARLTCQTGALDLPLSTKISDPLGFCSHCRLQLVTLTMHGFNQLRAYRLEQEALWKAPDDDLEWLSAWLLLPRDQVQAGTASLDIKSTLIPAAEPDRVRMQAPSSISGKAVCQ